MIHKMNSIKPGNSSLYQTLLDAALWSKLEGFIECFIKDITALRNQFNKIDMIFKSMVTFPQAQMGAIVNSKDVLLVLSPKPLNYVCDVHNPILQYLVSRIKLRWRNLELKMIL